jgi:hypothetical protein
VWKFPQDPTAVVEKNFSESFPQVVIPHSTGDVENFLNRKIPDTR